MSDTSDLRREIELGTAQMAEQATARARCDAIRDEVDAVLCLNRDVFRVQVLLDPLEERMYVRGFVRDARALVDVRRQVQELAGDLPFDLRLVIDDAVTRSWDELRTSIRAEIARARQR
jgi:hypothetical protein